MKTYDMEIKQKWGGSEAYKEYTEKTAHYTEDKWQQANEGLGDILAKFARCKSDGVAAGTPKVQALVKELQDHITDNYYTCTWQILAGLGQTYIADKRFQQNIDQYGPGTAEFISSAIEIYCK